MPAIDALSIWQQLADKCGEALNHYKDKHPNWTPYARRKQVLNQGAADFDSKYNPDNKKEKDHYRTDYYVSAEGYMNMHLEQNLAVLRHYFSNPKDVPQPVLFVDFGCGPMTSGLALADVFSRSTSNNRMQTAYFGVDASKNMVNKANSINKKYKLFTKHFKVVQDAEFDAKKIPNSFLKAKTVLLGLSFVLAPETLQESDEQPNTVAKKLANDWKIFIANETQCQETSIIYINPAGISHLHINWHLEFCPTMLSDDNVGDFEYTRDQIENVPVESYRDVRLEVIEGKRQ